MKFVLVVLSVLICNISYGQFETVSIDTFETVKVDIVEEIEIRNTIFAQVQLCANCLLLPVSYETEMVSHSMGHEKQKMRLFGNREGGRLRGLLSRLFGRDRRVSRRGCGG